MHRAAGALQTPGTPWAGKGGGDTVLCPSHLPFPFLTPSSQNRSAAGSCFPQRTSRAEQGYPPPQPGGTHCPRRVEAGAGVNWSDAGHVATEQVLLSITASAFKRCCLPGPSLLVSLKAAAFRPLFRSHRAIASGCKLHEDDRFPPFRQHRKQWGNATPDDLPA